MFSSPNHPEQECAGSPCASVRAGHAAGVLGGLRMDTQQGSSRASRPGADDVVRGEFVRLLQLLGKAPAPWRWWWLGAPWSYCHLRALAGPCRELSAPLVGTAPPSPPIQPGRGRGTPPDPQGRFNVTGDG